MILCYIPYFKICGGRPADWQDITKECNTACLPKHHSINESWIIHTYPCPGLAAFERRVLTSALVIVQ